MGVCGIEIKAFNIHDMKNASIFHGHGSNSNSFWHPWLKRVLEKAGWKVWLPDMPNTDSPKLTEWLPFALDNGNFDEETVLIGHSCGASMILSVLERISVKIDLAILVAGFIEPLDNSPDPILQGRYDWDTIKRHCSRFVVINSDNDPWGCDDKMGKKISDAVSGKLIILHDGHMGSDSFNQPYKEFPLLLDLITRT